MGAEEHSKREAIKAEAADWLAKLDSGRADLDAFEKWRAVDPAHAAAFAQIDAAWSRLDRVRALKRDGTIDPDLLAPAREQPSRRWLLRAASLAGVTALAGGGAMWVMNGRAYAETGVGERRAVRLNDGSLLDLNTMSRASWQISEQHRTVWLERGEAALEVAASATHAPLVLEAAGRAVPLQPGVFTARIRGQQAEIVPLRRDDTQQEASVRAGEALVVSVSAQRIETLSPSAVDAAGAWRRGEVVFDGDTLADAVTEYNRYLTTKIQIRDPQVAALRVGGRFTTHDPEEFIRAAQSAFGVRPVRAVDGSIELTRPDDASSENARRQ